MNIRYSILFFISFLIISILGCGQGGGGSGGTISLLPYDGHNIGEQFDVIKAKLVLDDRLYAEKKYEAKLVETELGKPIYVYYFVKDKVIYSINMAFEKNSKSLDYFEKIYDKYRNQITTKNSTEFGRFYRIELDEVYMIFTYYDDVDPLLSEIIDVRNGLNISIYDKKYNREMIDIKNEVIILPTDVKFGDMLSKQEMLQRIKGSREGEYENDIYNDGIEYKKISNETGEIIALRWSVDGIVVATELFYKLKKNEENVFNERERVNKIGKTMTYDVIDKNYILSVMYWDNDVIGVTLSVEIKPRERDIEE